MSVKEDYNHIFFKKTPELIESCTFIVPVSSLWNVYFNLNAIQVFHMKMEDVFIHLLVPWIPL